MFETLAANVAVFAVAGLLIAWVGTRLTVTCDRLADQSGLGEAFIGAIVLGAVTSLPGITASVTAAFDGRPALALSNALGGIAAQTAFLVVGDLVYRGVNLEHAAASVDNMMQGTLLIILLSTLALAMVGPDVQLLGVHLATPCIFAFYIGGQYMIYRRHDTPMWHPRTTRLTKVDVPDEIQKPGSFRRLSTNLVFSAAIVVSAGWALTRAAEKIATATQLSDSVMGALFTSVTTSLPELVTCVAAVRRGALTLAVGGIIGGNTFDTLFAATADLAYREGSIYRAGTRAELWLIAVSIVMTATLVLGLLRREERGPANIGFESVAVLALYILSVVVLITTF